MTPSNPFDWRNRPVPAVTIPLDRTKRYRFRGLVAATNAPNNLTIVPRETALADADRRDALKRHIGKS